MHVAMNEGPFCQSCALPLLRSDDFGSEANGMRNRDYCFHCYRDGAFTSPEMGMEEMRELCIEKLVAQKVMPRAQATALMNKRIPTLKRWHP